MLIVGNNEKDVKTISYIFVQQYTVC